MAALSRPAIPLTRRAFTGVLATAAAGCVAGGSLAATAIRVPPRLLALGDRDWLCAVVLAGRVRVLILLGDPSMADVPPVPRLLSAMRQRIDVVIAAADSIAALPTGFNERWRVRRTIPLIGPRTVAAEGDLEETALRLPDDVRVSILTGTSGMWRTSDDETSSATSLVQISRGQTVIAVARDLATISALAPSTATMALVLEGEVADELSRSAVPVVAVNASTVETTDLVDKSGSGKWIVRMFPEDVASFSLMPDGLSLPSWRQRIGTAP